MIDIKGILKKHGRTVSQFSNDFRLSRQEMKEYIEEFENNEKLMNGKLDVVFQSLFGLELNEHEFDLFYDIYEELTNKEYYCELTDASEEGSGLVIKALKDMATDVSSEEYDPNIYMFIKLMINTYKSNPVFKNIASYFLALNGVLDVEDLASNDNMMKVYISNFHILMNNYADDNLEFDEESYKTFIDKSKSVKDAIEKEREEKLQQFRKKRDSGERLTDEDLRNLVEATIR